MHGWWEGMHTEVPFSGSPLRKHYQNGCSQPFVVRAGTHILEIAVQRMAMKEAAPIYKSLTAEEKEQYIKLAEGRPCMKSRLCFSVSLCRDNCHSTMQSRNE